MKVSWLVPVMVGIVTACSSSSNSGTPGGGADAGPGGTTSNTPGATSADAPAKCRNLVTLYCARATTCTASDAGPVDQQRQDCEAGAGAALNCDAATRIGDAYDACAAALPAVDCAKFSTTDPLPSSCKGVVQAPARDAGPPGPQPGAAKPNIVLGRRSSLGEYDVYLGCVCNPTDPDSIASSVGLYGSGSKFSPNSIWNRYGTFGSDYSGQSACNKFASDPPVIVNNGQIVAKLTRNQFAAGAVTDPDVVALLNQEVCVP